MRATRSLAVAVVFGIVACDTPETGTMVPQLLFTISGETGLTAARDLTVDHAGNVYVFDYGDYVIRKFDPRGGLLATFGGTGDEPGSFTHLMAIRAHGDSLLSLDEGSISVFELSGQLRSRRALTDTMLSDYPRIHPDGRWIGGWIIGETAERALTYRRADGSERVRLASYALADVFHGIEPGVDFFINSIQAPFYVYGFLPDGRVLWVVTDSSSVFVQQDLRIETFYEAQATPVSYPEDEIAAMEERQAQLPPPLFMNVPQRYQLVHHLEVEETGDVWLYLMSQERTGLLRLSPTGTEKAFYCIETELDMLSARLTLANGRLYVMSSGREETAIYTMTIP